MPTGIGATNRIVVRDLAHRLWNKLRPGRDYIAESQTHAYEARHLSKSQLGEIFFAHKGRPIWKWAHYLDLYARHLPQGPIRFLEIGVWKGGSLELWRKYLGPEAVIYGIDIDPQCASFVDAPNQVRIGSQSDAEFLRRVVEEMGGVDFVLDDGSHRGRDQIASFEALFPLLPDGGIYAIEDLHTSYWPGFFGGGYKRRGTGISLVKSLIDDMHSHWHKRRGRDIGAIHVYDSIVFIEKRQAPAPKLVRTA